MSSSLSLGGQPQSQSIDLNRARAIIDNNNKRIGYLGRRVTALKALRSSVPESDSDEARISPIWCDLDSTQVRVIIDTYIEELEPEIAALAIASAQIEEAIRLATSGLVLPSLIPNPNSRRS
jgi:hypothetical protein